MPRIYVIEDDAAICRELVELLGRNGYKAVTCGDFSRAAEGALASAPDLILLDLTLPGTDGQLVCREIRATSDVPVMVLTSRSTEADEVVAMTLGADDFVAKPYSSQVLLAHVAALLRRSGAGASGQVLERGGVTLDLARSQVSVGGEPATGIRGSAGAGEKSVELTKNELRILALLMRRAGTIVSREDLMRELWASDEFVDDNTLTVNVNRLRATLARIGVSDWLVTHRGQGYSVR